MDNNFIISYKFMHSWF